MVEIQRETISVVSPNGAVSVLAQVGGGPNGLAVGPDGAFYICNNGGFLFQTIACVTVWDEPDVKKRCLNPTSGR